MLLLNDQQQLQMGQEGSLKPKGGHHAIFYWRRGHAANGPRKL